MSVIATRLIKLEPDTLRDLLAEHDVSQAELATEVGTSQPAISLMLAGKRNITKKMTTRIYDALEAYLKPMSDEEKEAMARWHADYSARNPIQWGCSVPPTPTYEDSEAEDE